MFLLRIKDLFSFIYDILPSRFINRNNPTIKVNNSEYDHNKERKQEQVKIPSPSTRKERSNLNRFQFNEVTSGLAKRHGGSGLGVAAAPEHLAFLLSASVCASGHKSPTLISSVLPGCCCLLPASRTTHSPNSLVVRKQWQDNHNGNLCTVIFCANPRNARAEYTG